MNRLLDALVTFEQICAHPLLVRTAMILFLNKMDLMSQKLKSSEEPISKFFTDYQGTNTLEDVARFFKNKFIACSHTDRSIYCHFTTVTDTQQMEKVGASVCHLIVRSALRSTGLM